MPSITFRFSFAEDIKNTLCWLVMQTRRLITPLLLLSLICGLGINACAARRNVEYRTIEVTSYCACGKCNGWERGSWKYLKLDFWNRYVNYGNRKGQKYTALSASNKPLRQVHPGLISFDSLRKPWMIPVRIVLFPWLLLPQKGTIAVDTDYYPFGTKFYVPGYGWGVAEDRGGAIKGPERLDLYYRFHSRSNKWGRQHVKVKIIRKN